MENTIENKEKFFAHYWGQEVLNNNCLTLKPKDFSSLDFEKYWLSLKPLSSITDEDAIGISNIRWCTLSKEHPYKNDPKEGRNVIDIIPHCSADNFVMLSLFDYLRSKGYALPYNGLSVEKQIEYGWVKLKN